MNNSPSKLIRFYDLLFYVWSSIAGLYVGMELILSDWQMAAVTTLLWLCTFIAWMGLRPNGKGQV